MSSMNTRAPTDLHQRMHHHHHQQQQSPYGDHTNNSNIDDDVPDDEQQQILHPGLNKSSPTTTSNPYTDSLLTHHTTQKDTTSPHDEFDHLHPPSLNTKKKDDDDDDEQRLNDVSSISKKNKMKHRPWQKSLEDSNHSSNNNNNHNSYDDDIVSSRWNTIANQSSPEDAKAATVNAVGIAATQLADRLDHDSTNDDDDDEDSVEEEEEDESLDHDDLHPSLSKRRRPTRTTRSATSSSPINEFTTPRKAADHNRVRMEALNLLNLANNKDSIGGYLVKGGTTTAVASTEMAGGGMGGNDSFKSSIGSRSNIHTSTELSKKKNRVQSALQGLSDGLGLDHNRRKYDKFTPDKMDYDEDDHDDTMEEVTIGRDGDDNNYNHHHEEPSKSSSSSSWAASRYSVDRHLMALHGGLSSRQVLKNMEQGQYHDPQQSVSATNMYKTSPYENEDHWNVSKGMRVPSTNDGNNRFRIWNTWIASMKESMEHMVTKVRMTVSKLDEEGHTTTLGSHRHMNHSSTNDNTSPRSVIFTSVAVTNFLHKLSPTSQHAAMKTFTDHPDGDVNFSAVDDYVYDRKMKRRKTFTILVTGILLLAVMIGVIAGVTNAHRSRTNGIVESIYSDVGEDLHFFVTSDVPHNMADEIKLTRELANLHPRDGDFLIHLGDIGDASVNMCTLSVYQDAADLLRQSPIPVFVLPGDNDWNNCPDPRSAFGYWMDELNRFEDNFDKDDNTNFPVVRRQLARSENFSFLHKGVLFIAFHLVDGKVQSESEWSLRIAEDVAWMDEEFNAHGVEEYRAVVILAHSAPTSKVGDFVWPLKNHLMKIKKPVLYIHANNDEEGMLEYNPFPEDVPRLTVLRLEKGYRVAPTQVTIETGRPKPFKLKMTQS